MIKTAGVGHIFVREEHVGARAEVGWVRKEVIVVKAEFLLIYESCPCHRQSSSARFRGQQDKQPFNGST